MQAIIRAADIQDRDGGVLLKGSLFGLYPFLLKLCADSGYQGPEFGPACAPSATRSTWKSSSDPTSTSLSCCRSGGSSSERSVG
jgi:hypothetical protein